MQCSAIAPFVLFSINLFCAMHSYTEVYKRACHVYDDFWNIIFFWAFSYVRIYFIWTRKAYKTSA